MKAKTFFIFLTILSILILSISCSQQKTEWQGTIEEVNGVTVVKNPKELRRRNFYFFSLS